LVAALRRTARERGGPLPSIDVADALLDERNTVARSAFFRQSVFGPKVPEMTGVEYPHLRLCAS
jgi:hypothetical protein